MTKKQTKIVCTIGPASESKEVLKKMVRAGMNVARLNFSHGTYDSFIKVIRNIRAVSKELNTPIAILQDLQGPKIRVGEMPEEGINLKNKQKVTLTTKNVKGSQEIIPIQYKKLPRDVSKKDRILINDGLIELKVDKVGKTDIQCRVLIGGLVKSRKGINVPTASISAHPITPKDKKDLAFGLKHDVDYVALSFVKNAKNIEELRNLIRQKRGQAKIIAKVERHEAVKNLEEIINEADGVMVARGDLGVEISPEKVPIVQKRMIHMANIHGKPVITATEMLQSMIENPRPTRAEVSDIANAIFDHTDAIMLSNESAIGKYPVRAVTIMSKVAISTENELKKHEQFLPNHLFEDKFPVSYAICSSAARLAKNIGAKMIVSITFSGFTTKHVAKHRIYIPIITITENPKVQRQLQLVWGVKNVLIRKINLNHPLAPVRKLLLDKGLANKVDKVVVVTNASNEEKLISTLVL